MTIAVWKYEIPYEPRFKIRMPICAQPLDVQIQKGKVVMWALVGIENPMEDRYFQVWGTGHEHKDTPGNYVGTFQLHEGSLVLHLFVEPV